MGLPDVPIDACGLFVYRLPVMSTAGPETSELFSRQRFPRTYSEIVSVTLLPMRDAARRLVDEEVVPRAHVRLRRRDDLRLRAHRADDVRGARAGGVHDRARSA